MGIPAYNEAPWRYNNITTNTTTTVKTGTGLLHCITVNNPPTGANTLTIFDSTTGSGTKIGTAVMNANDQTLLYDVGFGNGLTIVTTAATTPGDYTVVYS